MVRISIALMLVFLLLVQVLTGQQAMSVSMINSLPIGKTILSPEQIHYVNGDKYKGNAEKPFHIEAIYETTECSNSLTSIQINNAHLPLTWYELDDLGLPVKILINPELYYFNNHTTYVVEDFSKNLDTIYIDFHQALAVYQIYPNPHRGIIYIDYAAMEATEVDIMVTDVSGKQIFTGQLVLNESGNQAKLDLSRLGQGIYFLSLKGLCINELKKIIHLK